MSSVATSPDGVAEQSRRLAIIGGGQMARAMAAGMFDAAVVDPAKTVVVDPSATAAEYWREHFPGVARVELREAAAECDVVLFAVKPDTLPRVVPKFRESEALLISIAAGVSLASLQTDSGTDRWVRVMPNTPAQVGMGAFGYCYGGGASDEDRGFVDRLLSACGVAVEVTERQIDAVTGLSGSGPAYVCLIVESLADGGVAAGLPREVAMKLAVQTVAGTARMIGETGRHPGELKDAVASPGGTTIAALAALEQNGIRAALIDAVTTAAARSRALGG